jgi:protein ImuB
MTRFACVEVREFSLQAMMRMRPELRAKPVVILDGEPPFEQVRSLSRSARTLGVEPGMTKLDLEMFPAVHILPRSRAEESIARAALLQCAGTFSPRVEEQTCGNRFVCVLDIMGMERLFGSEQTLCGNLRQRIEALGMEPSIAVSGNFHAARCLARGNDAKHILAAAPGMEASALASLPLTVLDLSEDHQDTFVAWGISTLGDLGKLEEAELISRLGQPGKAFRQLARGEAPHHFIPIEESFSLEERIELESPVELLDSLLFVVGVALDQLIIRARSSILALASVTLTLNLERGEPHTRTVRPALPTNQRQLWLKLIHLDLEAHPPPAAIVALTLRAEHGSESTVQLGLFAPQVPESTRLDVTLARIRSIVGEDRVGQAVLKDTHHPDAFRMEPFTVQAATTHQPEPQTKRVALRQIRPPEPVAVTLQQQQPTSFVFRNKKYLVDSCYGPWHFSGDWWNPTLWSLEQWDLVARGGEALLCCCLTHDLIEDRWQLEALYD